MSKSKNTLNKNDKKNEIKDSICENILEKYPELPKKLSVLEIASIFEQRAKQNTPVNISTRKKSIDYFSKTLPNLPHNLEKKKYVFPRSKNFKINYNLSTVDEKEEEKFLSVSEISKKINKEIVKINEEQSPPLKKRSLSVNNPNINKKSEEKLKVKSLNEIDIDMILKPIDNHYKKIAQFYQKDNMIYINNIKNPQQEILKNKVAELFIEKQLKNNDLSVISEKDDIVTSISFMDQTKENRIKYFINSTINEIKSIYTDQNIRNSNNHKNLNDSFKLSFLRNRRNKISADKILINDEKKRSDQHDQNIYIRETELDQQIFENTNFEDEFDSHSKAMNKIENINITESVDANITKLSSDEDPFFPFNSKSKDSVRRKPDNLSCYINSNFENDPVTKIKNSYNHEDFNELNLGESKYNDKIIQKNLEKEKNIAQGEVIENKLEEKVPIKIQASMGKEYEDHKEISNNINYDIFINLYENAIPIKEIEEIKDKKEIINMCIPKINPKLDEVNLLAFSKDSSVTNRSNNNSLQKIVEKLVLSPNIFEKYLIFTLMTMNQFPLLLNLIKKFHIKFRNPKTFDREFAK